MNNLRGYDLSHPHSDSLSSTWFFFTYKYKLYQLAISIDNFHNINEYDLKLFSFNKYRYTDKNKLSDIYNDFDTKGIPLSNNRCKEELKKIFSNLNAILIKKEIVKNIEISNSFKNLLENSFLKNTIRKYISDVYYELVMNRVN